MYDIIIVGMGSAGMSAALYAKKANLKVLILDSNCPGGILNKVKTIDNFIGYSKISGSDLALNMFNHIRSENIEYKISKVLRIELNDNYKRIYTSSGEYTSKCVILSSGRNLNRNTFNNEDKFLNKGISYCAICDGELYKDKNVIVIGNDEYAYNDAIYLSNICSNVKIVTNNKEITFNNKNNIEVINEEVVSFDGNDSIDKVILKNNEIKCDGVFICNGSGSNNNFIKVLNITDEKGYILVDNNMKTNIDGIYACGDAIKKEIYQVCTSISEGCISSINANKYIKDNFNDIS